MCVSAVSTQDKVVASRLPNHWALKSIFITGIVYGLYLTLSSWCLYYVATHTSFFREKLKMHDLRYKPDSYLAEWCLSDNNPNRNVSLPDIKDSSWVMARRQSQCGLRVPVLNSWNQDQCVGCPCSLRSPARPVLWHTSLLLAPTLTRLFSGCTSG